MTDRLSVDVLIVGAGPAGLATANYLGMAGVRTLVVERNPGTVDEPRAVSIDDESLRGMQTMGLVDRLVPNTLPGYGARYYSPGQKEFARVKPVTREFGQIRRSAFHQPEFEAILCEGLSRFPSVDIRFGHECVSFEQDADSVTAEIRNSDGETIQVTARYLAACDGGRSDIRKALGVELVGSSFEERWLVFDTVEDWDDTPDSIAYCDHRRPAITLPGPGKTRRWEFMLHPGEDADAFEKEDHIAKLLHPYIGDHPVNIVRRVVYTFHARVADKWKIGRVFLLGDAAHLTPPYAGQGMNSGQRDAANFAWKVAFVVQGRLPASILETYETERRDHAWSLIKMAIQIGWVMVPRNWFHTWGQVAFFRLAGLIPPLRNYFIGMKFKPVPRFRDGFLLSDGRGAKKTRVGRMLPQPDVIGADGTPLQLDDVMGPGFALLALDIDPEMVAAAADQPFWKTLDCRAVALGAGPTGDDTDGVVSVAWEGGLTAPGLAPYSGHILLVRPDRYIAATFDPADSADVAARLEALLH